MIVFFCQTVRSSPAPVWIEPRFIVHQPPPFFNHSPPDSRLVHTFPVSFAGPEFFPPPLTLILCKFPAIMETIMSRSGGAVRWSTPEFYLKLQGVYHESFHHSEPAQARSGSGAGGGSADSLRPRLRRDCSDQHCPDPGRRAGLPKHRLQPLQCRTDGELCPGAGARQRGLSHYDPGRRHRLWGGHHQPGHPHGGGAGLYRSGRHQQRLFHPGERRPQRNLYRGRRLQVQP